MAMFRYGYATLATPIVSPDKWVDKKVTPGRVKVAKDVIAKFDPSRWLLSHATIMASVDVDTADFGDCDKNQRNFLIKPEYSIFVNNNGDSWERELLRKAAKTFLGADNFIEHVQIESLSKGKVIDVAIREVPFIKGPDGNDLTTLYVDILIATNKSHRDLIDKILSNEYSALSMGCLIAYSQCSQCGRIAADETKLCNHIKYFKNNYFIDKNGIKRIIAELCGRAEDPASCKFVDASWVRKPAFEGAVKRNIIEPKEDLSEKINKAVAVPSFTAQPGMLLRAASQSATEILRKIGAEEKAAPGADTPAPAGDDTDFPAAPEGDAPLTEDKAPPAADAEAPAEGAPAEGTPPAAPGAEAAPPTPPIEEPPEDATVDEVEKMMQKVILNKIRRKLLKDEAVMKTEMADRPIEDEDKSHSSMIRSADDHKRVVLAARKLGNEKLINGLMIMSNLKDWTRLSKYGYSRNDVLGMLHFVDRTVSQEPIGSDLVQALAHCKCGSNDHQALFTELIVETGRQPNVKEARKILKWANILNKFEI